MAVNIISHLSISTHGHSHSQHCIVAMYKQDDTGTWELASLEMARIAGCRVQPLLLRTIR
uniref:Uncharacterized protein n=1 Tax=Arundo donax TaxID=35708 RepID=A0A0A8XZX5_ARUDO